MLELNQVAGFPLIAGPCALEGDELNLQIAHEVARVGLLYGLATYFKGSYDKANRTRWDSPRGPGLEDGLRALAVVKAETGLPIVTDVHEPWHAEAVAQVADVLQIPAFLSRQTDLIMACAHTGKVVNIKRGQWMSLDELLQAREKALMYQAPRVWQTERGTVRAPGQLVVDMADFRRAPLIYDVTHSVPGPEFALGMARAAAAAGCSGLYVEVHPNPGGAPSDGSRMLPLDRLGALVGAVVRVLEALQ